MTDKQKEDILKVLKNCSLFAYHEVDEKNMECQLVVDCGEEPDDYVRKMLSRVDEDTFDEVVGELIDNYSWDKDEAEEVVSRMIFCTRWDFNLYGDRAYKFLKIS